MVEIIPAIDLIDGCCVRLLQGDYDKKTTYSKDPVATAKSFEASGMTRLHLVDLDGAKAGVPQNLHVLKEITEATSLVIDFSGGIREGADLEAAFAAGATQIAIGSAAVKEPKKVAKWFENYGAEKIILGADVAGEEIRVSGWTEGAGVNIFDFLRQWSELGAKEILCTSISQDGMMSGPDISLYSRLREQFPNLDLIASGGVGCMLDIFELEELGMTKAIVGKALYEGTITLPEVEKYYAR